MSSFNSLSRRTLIFGGAILSFSACGLTPVYGPDGTGTALHGRVALRDPDDPDSFALNRQLSKRLGPEDVAIYSIDYRLTTAVLSQGINEDDVITRYSLNGTADFSLTEIATGRIVTQGRVSNFTSYSATGTTIATLSSERDAHERLMVMLADQIVTRLLATDLRTQK